jgi:predicted Zn-dependent protease
MMKPCQGCGLAAIREGEAPMNAQLRLAVRVPVALLFALGSGSCAINPATGESMLSLVTESQEIEMGRAYSQQVEGTMAVYDDPALGAYVDGIGQQLAAVSERPQLPWSFKVIDDPTVNAFAVPGGFLYVTRGILTHFNSEAELAAVLGHEIGHVTARHSVEQISRAQLGGLLLGVGSILSEDVRRFGGLAQTGLGILFLSYGRDDEHQADMLGVRYALRKDYDPREAIEVHEMLGRQTEARGGSGIPNWLSTHPSSTDRIDRIRSHVDTVPATRLAATEVRADEYLRQLDGVVFGENPRHGFFQGSLFRHPDLEFEMRFPSDWETANLTQAVMAMSPAEDAIVQLRLSTTAGHAAAPRAFFSQEGVRDRRVSAGTVNGFPATTGNFEVATQDGVLEGLATFLDYDGRTYQILAYTPKGKLSSYDQAFRNSIGSFDRLTDRAALAVEPLQIQLITVQRSTTLRRMAQSRELPILLEALALVNGLGEDETIPAGRTVKWVIGEPAPGT